MWPLLEQGLFLNAAICLTFRISGCVFEGFSLVLAGARDKVKRKLHARRINIKRERLGVLI